MAVLPWKRLFDRGLGTAVMYAWSVLDIVLITVLIGVSGSASNEMFFLYAFTTIFFMVSYPRTAQIALLVLTFISYLAVLAATGWPVSAGELVVRLALLAILAYFAGFLSDELRREITGRVEALADSRRRATLLASVVRAARTVSSLQTDRVLRSVVDATGDIGFEAADLVLYDQDTETFRTVQARGMPETYDFRRARPATAGISGMVRKERRTVVLNDYAIHPRGILELRRAGFHAVVGTPVWIAGRLAGVLGAGTRERREVRAEEIEAFELLASIAGRALENAGRFEDERRMVERLAELDRMKSDFISTASHELRTPLTVIQGMGLTVEQQWEHLDEETRLELVRRLNQNARTLQGIVETLLDFSLVEGGRLKANRERVQLDELVSTLVSRLQSLIGERSLTVDVGHADPVRADPVLLDRVLENLLANAVKHTPAGTPVRISTAQEDGAVVVTVADGGPGIPSEVLSRLGQRFVRGGDPNSRPRGGTGLGLALVREILALHGSSLEVWSEPGRGSRFSFRLPLERAASLARPA
jgi:signal transduction histidine kinase